MRAVLISYLAGVLTGVVLMALAMVQKNVK